MSNHIMFNILLYILCIIKQVEISHMTFIAITGGFSTCIRNAVIIKHVKLKALITVTNSNFSYRNAWIFLAVYHCV